MFISKQYFHLASYPVLNSGKAWVRGCIFTAPHSETSQITNLYLSISTPVCANLMPSKNAVKFDKRHNTTGPDSSVNMLFTTKLVFLLLYVEVAVLKIAGEWKEIVVGVCFAQHCVILCPSWICGTIKLCNKCLS